MLTLDKNTIQHIVDNYQSQKGRVRWSSAFEEHPEWQKQMGVNLEQPYHRQALLRYVKKLKKEVSDIRTKGKGFSNQIKEKRRQYQRTYRLNKLNRIESIKCHFCPSCGTNLDAIEMALKLAS